MLVFGRCMLKTKFSLFSSFFLIFSCFDERLLHVDVNVFRIYCKKVIVAPLVKIFDTSFSRVKNEIMINDL